MLNYIILPPHMQHDMKEYIENGVPQGSFMRAIIANDFVHAAVCADWKNKDRLFAYAQFLHDEAPMGCCGSYDIYNAWIRAGGLKGIMEDEEET